MIFLLQAATYVCFRLSAARNVQERAGLLLALHYMRDGHDDDDFAADAALSLRYRGFDSFRGMPAPPFSFSAPRQTRARRAAAAALLA